MSLVREGGGYSVSIVTFVDILANDTDEDYDEKKEADHSDDGEGDPGNGSNRGVRARRRVGGGDG